VCAQIYLVERRQGAARVGMGHPGHGQADRRAPHAQHPLDDHAPLGQIPLGPVHGQPDRRLRDAGPRPLAQAEAVPWAHLRWLRHSSELLARWEVRRLGCCVIRPLTRDHAFWLVGWP